MNSYDSCFIFLAIIPVFIGGLNVGNVTAYKRICLGDYPSVINASKMSFENMSLLLFYID